jgi:hypothetical protein
MLLASSVYLRSFSEVYEVNSQLGGSVYASASMITETAKRILIKSCMVDSAGKYFFHSCFWVYVLTL